MLKSFLNNPEKQRKTLPYKPKQRASETIKRERNREHYNYTVVSNLEKLMEENRVKSFLDLERRTGISYIILSRMSKGQDRKGSNLKYLDLRAVSILCKFFNKDIGDLFGFGGYEKKLGFTHTEKQEPYVIDYRSKRRKNNV